MNRYALSICMASLLAAPIAQAADEEDHSAHHPGADQSQAAPAQDEKAAGMKMEKMQEKMKKMREQMKKIHSAKNPEERHKLMQEHMQSMQEGMKMMGRKGAEMKGGDMMAQAKKEDQTELMTDAGDGMEMCMMMKKQKSVESRMDMMQQMMEQMMEHEAAEQEMELRR